MFLWCVHRNTYICMWVGTCIYVHVCEEARNWCHVSSLICLHFIHWDTVSQWILSSTILLSLPEQLALETPLSAIAGSGITGSCQAYLAFTFFLRWGIWTMLFPLAQQMIYPVSYHLGLNNFWNNNV